jgi:hypothetical protein
MPFATVKWPIGRAEQSDAGIVGGIPIAEHLVVVASLGTCLLFGEDDSDALSRSLTFLACTSDRETCSLCLATRQPEHRSREGASNERLNAERNSS